MSGTGGRESAIDLSPRQRSVVDPHRTRKMLIGACHLRGREEATDHSDAGATVNGCHPCVVIVRLRRDQHPEQSSRRRDEPDRPPAHRGRMTTSPFGERRRDCADTGHDALAGEAALRRGAIEASPNARAGESTVLEPQRARCVGAPVARTCDCVSARATQRPIPPSSISFQTSTGIAPGSVPATNHSV